MASEPLYAESRKCSFDGTELRPTAAPRDLNRLQPVAENARVSPPQIHGTHAEKSEHSLAPGSSSSRL